MARNILNEFLVYLRGLNTSVQEINKTPAGMPKEIHWYLVYKLKEFMMYDINPNIHLVEPKNGYDYDEYKFVVTCNKLDESVETRTYSIEEFINILESKYTNYDLQKDYDFIMNEGILKNHPENYKYTEKTDDK